MAQVFHVPSSEEVAEIRRRLPAVGFEYSGDVTGADVSTALVAPGMPRPKLRGVPIPATSLVEDSSLSIIRSDADSWRGWLADRRCDLCVESVALEERAWFVGELLEHEDGDRVLARGVMHRRCWLATSHWCPHLREGLLEGWMVAGSCAVEDLLDQAHTKLLRDDSDAPPVTPGAIAEFSIAIEVVRPEWPFRRVSEPGSVKE